MKKNNAYFVLVMAIFFIVQSIHSQNKLKYGVNLGKPSPWDMDQIYVDRVKQSLGWMPFNADSSVGYNYVFNDLNIKGLPNPGRTAILALIWDLPDPSNDTFVISWSNLQSVELFVPSNTGIMNASASKDSTINNTNKLIFMNNSRFLFLKVKALSSNTTSSNITCKRLRDKNNQNVFTQEFLDYVGQFHTLRFMDWAKPLDGNRGHADNDHNIVEITDYPKDNALFKSFDHVINMKDYIRICNLVKSNPWICFPTFASDALVKNLYDLISLNLDTSLVLYCETGNEIWSNDYHSEIIYNRAGRVHKILDSLNNISQKKLKLKKVLSAQAVNSANFFGTNLRYYKEQSNDKNPDIIAIAPYFGGEISDTDNLSRVIHWNLDSVFLQLSNNPLIVNAADSDFNYIAQIQSYQNVMRNNNDYQNIELVLYEAGQSIVNPNNPFITNLQIQANRDDKMDGAYTIYLQKLKTLGIQNIMLYNSHGKFTKYGSWGLKERFTDPDSISPKYRAVKNMSNQN
ncbi:MAG TPA: hypothetical protein PK006_02405 [Saprospiraceae bacterium]|nr:hypothetical protein [Saprospiraceae bacterium]